MAARLPADAVIELTVARIDGTGQPLTMAPKMADGTVILGRGIDSPLQLEDPSVSRRHLSLTLHDGLLWLEVLSPVGAVVNGRWQANGEGRALNGPAEVLIPGYQINIAGAALIEVATAYVLPPTFVGLTRGEWLLIGNTLAAMAIAALYFAYL